MKYFYIPLVQTNSLTTLFNSDIPLILGRLSVTTNKYLGRFLEFASSMQHYHHQHHHHLDGFRIRIFWQYIRRLITIFSLEMTTKKG